MPTTPHPALPRKRVPRTRARISRRTAEIARQKIESALFGKGAHTVYVSKSANATHGLGYVIVTYAPSRQVLETLPSTVQVRVASRNLRVRVIRKLRPEFLAEAS